MGGISEPRPGSIVVFELLSYIALVPRGLQLAKIFTGAAVLPAAPLNAGVILIHACLIFLVARRRKNFARWVLLGFLILLLASAFVALRGAGPAVIVTSSLQAFLLPLMALALQLAAICFAFTRRAGAWLAQR
ncbi:MAG: hypothetical protein AB7E79_02605 [Rhodospirillaceae bacterium]